MIRRHALGLRALLMAADAALAVFLLVGLSACGQPDRLHAAVCRRVVVLDAGGNAEYLRLDISCDPD